MTYEAWRISYQSSEQAARAAYAECARLRAKIAEMERQEPVATIRLNRITGNPSVDFIPGHRYLHHSSSLYTLPGAQSVPDVDALAQLIREIDGKHQLGAGALAERIVEWLAAAPEAKP